MTAATTEPVKETFRLNAQAIVGLAILIVFLSVVLTLATVYVARYLSSPEMYARMTPPAEQSYEALTYVRGHVEEYWYDNGIMPQYIPLSQLGVDPKFVKDLPAVQFVRIGGAPVDKQSTYIEAAIKPNLNHPTAGHSVIMTVDSMPEPSITGRQTYYRCYVRGPNGTPPAIDMKNFPGICRHSDPLGGMGVEGSGSSRALEWPILR